jgi:AI-2 transport protein TqsA
LPQPLSVKLAPTRLRTLQACVAVLAVIAVGFTLYALRGILTPLVLAVFLLLMIDGMARALTRRASWLPKKVALPAAVAFIVGVFALAVWLAADNGADFATHGAAYTAKLDVLLAEFAQRFHLANSPTIHGLIAQVSPGEAAKRAAEALRGFGESAIFVLIYLGFLLASRRGFLAKAAELFPGEDQRAEAVLIFNRVAHGVESYIWVQTVVGVVIAVASALLMWALGLEHIAFWAFIIFLANYIPAIGAAIGVLFPPLFGLLQFDELWRPVAMLIGMEAIHFGVSHVLQPRMQGRSLNVDPLVVLFALAFWGAVWGVTGAFLSTPLTVAAMAVLAEFGGTRWIAVLLSGDGRPYEDMEAEAAREEKG